MNGRTGFDLEGYVRRVREGITSYFTLEEYLSLPNLVYQVGQVISAEVETERLYTLSLGSKQSNSHVHWHRAPLPPGLAYEDQQLSALSLDRGVLDVPESEIRDLARHFRARLLEQHS